MLVDFYVDNNYLYTVFLRDGFAGVAKLFEARFPPKNAKFSIRTGDFGEVVAHMVLQDVFGHTIPIMKICYKINC